MERRNFLRLAAAAGAVRLVDSRRAWAAAPAFTSGRGFDAARRFAPTRAGRIAYVERGRGRAALFLHGFPLSSYQWRGAVELLAAQRRCIAPDFLALGRTEVASGQDVGPDAQVAMLVELLDALKVKDVDLVASDSGGAVAQLLLVRHPARVRTLLLTNCDTEPDSPPPALKPVIELSRAGTWVDEWLVPSLEDTALARSEKGIGGACYSEPQHPTDDAVREYFGPLASAPRRKALAHAYALALEKNPLAGIAPALGRSTAPTRIVWGTADTIFSAAGPAYLDRTFGRSRGVRLLPGRKLFFPEEVPDLIAEEARRLWSEA